LLERAGAILRQFASNMSDTNPRYDFVGPDWSTGLHTQEASAIFTQSHWRGVLQQLANRQSRLGTLVIAGLSSSHSESAWSPQLGAAALAAGSAVIASVVPKNHTHARMAPNSSKSIERICTGAMLCGSVEASHGAPVGRMRYDNPVILSWHYWGRLKQSRWSPHDQRLCSFVARATLLSGRP
jgi:hypothetical protein